MYMFGIHLIQQRAFVTLEKVRFATKRTNLLVEGKALAVRVTIIFQLKQKHLKNAELVFC